MIWDHKVIPGAFGFLLASLHFGAFNVRVPSAVSVVWMAIVGSVLAVYWKSQCLDVVHVVAGAGHFLGSARFVMNSQEHDSKTMQIISNHHEYHEWMMENNGNNGNKNSQTPEIRDHLGRVGHQAREES